MRFTHGVAGTLVALSLALAPAAFAAEPAKMGAMPHMGKPGEMGKMGKMDDLMKSCDMDHDGMMSRSEMHAHMDKMFDRLDAKKTGQLDRKQTQEFAKQFTKPSGG